MQDQSTKEEFKAWVAPPKDQPLELTECTKATCVLAISVGQHYHEGDKLKAAIDLINRIFPQGRCLIFVCDSLQRHNQHISKSITDQKAYQLAKAKGDKWLERNKPIYSQLRIPYEIKRWDEWLNDKKAKNYLKSVNAHYDNNVEFHTAVEASITQYSNRYQRQSRTQSINNQAMKQHCKNYLLEECALIMHLWIKQNGVRFLLYPGNMTSALQVAYKHFVLPEIKDFFWLKLRFKKVKVKPGLVRSKSEVAEFRKAWEEIKKALAHNSKPQSTNNQFHSSPYKEEASNYSSPFSQNEKLAQYISYIDQFASNGFKKVANGYINH